VAKHRTFELEELAFFWEPRPWKPDIEERFGPSRPGSSDIRDAIIVVDDEGGHGFLHWYPDRAAWGLTDKGKGWVAGLLSAAKLRDARDWKPKKPAPRPAKPPPPEPQPVEFPEEVPAEEPAKPLTREEEIAALAFDQRLDDDA
jgi:hypothetical protein